MIKTGLDIFLEHRGICKNRSLALIANQSSVTCDLRYSWDALLKNGFHLKKIFAPEHGIFSTEQDQVPVKDTMFHGLPVRSLYMASRASLFPQEEDLADINTILFDVQDIGSRYYTYATTLAYVMQSIRGRDMELIVLDRPNPLNGLKVEGPILQKKFRSFVGEITVPVRHGLTIGELAKLYQFQEKLDLDLKVVTMQGWQRAMHFPDTGLFWVPPSPNMPSLETALVYPGLCLVEGTNLSEGRGTTMPFQFVGAPFINGYELASKLREQDIPGVHFRPVRFKPAFHKYREQDIEGIFIHLKDPEKILPFFTGVSLLKTIYDLYPFQFGFIQGGYEFNDAHPAFDILCGNSVIRQMILEKEGIGAIRESWEKEQENFLEDKRAHHLYDH